MTADKPKPLTDLYLRLSDFRDEDDATFEIREARLRALAAQLGWEVHRVITENDLEGNGDGMKPKPASAWKRKKIRLPSGEMALRTVRPGFRDVLLPDVMKGINLIGEDLDRLLRQPRDGEDLLDAVEMSGASARSLSGSLTLTDGGTDTERMTARIMAAVANKSSSDTARRVAWGRERWAGKSYFGGPRPYGYRVHENTEEHQRTPARGRRRSPGDPAGRRRHPRQGHLAQGCRPRPARPRGALRDRSRVDPETVGTCSSSRPWRPRHPRASPRLGASRTPARWSMPPGPRFWRRERWTRLRDMLTDPSRRTTTANEPRWLVSGFATCGVCGKPLKVGGSGRGRGPAYVGTDCGHMRRAAGSSDNLTSDPAGVDDLIAQLVVARLSRPDAGDLLKPQPRPGIDVKRLRAEARKLAERKAAQMRMHAAGIVDDADLAVGLRAIRAQLAQIDRELAAAADQPDPLAEFRGKPAAAVWMELGIARRRAVVQVLIESVIIQPSGRRGNRFHPDTVEVAWRVQPA